MKETVADIVKEMRKMKRYANSDSNDCRYVAYWCYQTFADRLEAAEKRERLPEVRAKGKWENGTDYEYEFAYCSECGRMVFADWCSHNEAREKIVNFHDEYRYCPGCGAKMEGGRYVK